MMVLGIDASAGMGTVAVLRDGVIIAEGAAAMRGVDEERLMPEVAATIARAAITLDDVDQIICGDGPGTFTSIRIAASIGKGLAFGSGRPLYAVSSLALLLTSVSRAPGSYVVALDALRGEWYAEGFSVDANGGIVPTVELATMSAGALARLVIERDATLVGAMVTESSDGAASAVTSPTDTPHARGIARLYPTLAREVDLASWEPRYGRLAEAQVKWEAAHGRPLDVR